MDVAAGLGLIERISALEGVTDILIDGFDRVLIDRGSGIELISASFGSPETLDSLATQLISEAGRRLDHANPFADVSHPVFGRVHAQLASGCNPTTHLSIRLHSKARFDLLQLEQRSMLSQAVAMQLRGLLARRESILISGATGSGKTTLLRALLLECQNQRVIALEDVAELGPAGPNFISLQTRQPNLEGKGEIDLQVLLREALRMRPDRIALGEVRGSELLLLLQALNTGHSGAGATIHANSLHDVPSRLASIAQFSGFDIAALARQLVSAIPWVLHLQPENGQRRVQAVGRFSLSGSGQLEVEQVAA